jgi:hypothetical protein
LVPFSFPSGGKKAAFIALREGASSAQKAFLAALVAHLDALPENLPSELEALPLFTAQGIVSSGLQLKQIRIGTTAPSHIVAVSLQSKITRKTFLPIVVDFIKTRAWWADGRRGAY